MAAEANRATDRAGDGTPPADHLAVDCAVRAAVAQQLGEPRFSLWFGDGVGLGLSGDGNALQVQVPNAFFRQWMQQHFSASLLDAVETVTGRRVQLSFALQSELDPPLDDVVAPFPDPARPHPGGTVSVPIPGNPKTPLSNPATPTGPGQPHVPRFTPPAKDHRPEQDLGLPTRQGAPAVSRSLRRLEEFVTGPGNQLAHAAAREMVQTAGKSFNPLVIHGPVGLGKTHLLEAVTQGLRMVHPGLNVLSITAEAFTNSFLESMRAGTLSGFRNRYRALGALAMDDVHFLAVTRATQNEFLHTFNSLLHHGAAVIVTADRHPRRITRLMEELVTRFLGGMVVKLEPPDQTTRRRSWKRGPRPEECWFPTRYLITSPSICAPAFERLEGALSCVITHAALTGRRLDLALARNALRDTIQHTTQIVGLRDVERVVCQLFQIEPEALRSDSRTRALAYPRMLAMYLARKYTGAAYSEIGRYFGDRNHSTVISADRKVQRWLRDEERTALLPGFETVADVLVDLERTLGGS